MGLLYWQAKMLLDAQRAGVPTQRLLTIGRQSLFLHPSELLKIRKTCPVTLESYEWGEYSDRFFKQCLNVCELSTLDYSSYEGADLIHDLNQPIAAELKGRFDVIVEGGTLEHVFNFPVAIANLMQMTKVGGVISASTVANNMCGHGFYQFSPELIFRIFTRENGYQLGKVFALQARYPDIELVPLSNAFEVTDPASIGARVGLMTQRPVMLFFQAQRTADVLPFAEPPIQSDYAVAWVADSQTGVSKIPRWIRSLPFFRVSRNWLRGRRQTRQFSLTNQRVFRKLTAEGLE